MRYYFLDRIVELNPGNNARAIKNVTITEDIFTDHFPGYPVYPGALLIEAMAQLSGLLLEKTVKTNEERLVLPQFTIAKNVKVREIVLPGDSLILDSAIEGITHDSAMTNVSINCDDRRIADGKLFFILLDMKEVTGGDPIPELETSRRSLEIVSNYRRKKRQKTDIKL